MFHIWRWTWLAAMAVPKRPENEMEAWMQGPNQPASGGDQLVGSVRWGWFDAPPVPRQSQLFGGPRGDYAVEWDPQPDLLNEGPSGVDREEFAAAALALLSDGDWKPLRVLGFTAQLLERRGPVVPGRRGQ